MQNMQRIFDFRRKFCILGLFERNVGSKKNTIQGSKKRNSKYNGWGCAVGVVWMGLYRGGALY